MLGSVGEYHSLCPPIQECTGIVSYQADQQRSGMAPKTHTSLISAREAYDLTTSGPGKGNHITRRMKSHPKISTNIVEQ